MKTAMMQLRDKLETSIFLQSNDTDERSLVSKATLQSIIDVIDYQMLEVEKEQILNAYDDWFSLDYANNESYYTKTFTTKE